ncbi:MAG: hypothetical protein RIT15_106, partial [Pseudomonadota bacterium]
LSTNTVPAMQPSHKRESMMSNKIARPVLPCAIGISQLRIILRCGNGASGGKGFIREGSERAEFRCVDTIRINKLDANDSGFRDFLHDLGQKPPLFWRARQESNLRPLASEANTLSTELRALGKLVTALL